MVKRVDAYIPCLVLKKLFELFVTDQLKIVFNALFGSEVPVPFWWLIFVSFLMRYV